MPKYDELKDEYALLWSTLAIRPENLSAVRDVVETILLPSRRDRYKTVQAETGVPWMIIACIHSLEASVSFNGHLHNGDSLRARTTHVPSGRPKTGTPPFTWEDSAIDALKMKQSGETGGWSIPECLFYFERYNGWGYRTGAGRGTTPPHRSPYLWSFTTHYKKGKYTADSRWDDNAVSRQVGAVAILRLLVEATGIEPGDHENVHYGSPISPYPLLCSGSRGKDVATLQEKLRAAGQDPGVIDGVFGSLTEAKVIAFQLARSLVADGVVGPVTWSALLAAAPDAQKAGTPAGLRKTLLDFAVAEASKGRSHAPGNEIDTLVLDPLRPILKELGHLGSKQDDTFYNWCAAWTTYVCRHAGIPIPDRYKNYWASSARVDAWRNMAIDTKSWIRRGSAAPRPGDVVVYDWDNDSTTDHIGIVREYFPTDHSIMACEGNHNNRESIRKRSESSIAGYIDIENLAAALGPVPRSAPKTKSPTNPKRITTPKKNASNK